MKASKIISTIALCLIFSSVSLSATAAIHNDAQVKNQNEEQTTPLKDILKPLYCKTIAKCDIGG